MLKLVIEKAISECRLFEKMTSRDDKTLFFLKAACSRSVEHISAGGALLSCFQRAVQLLPCVYPMRNVWPSYLFEPAGNPNFAILLNEK